MIDEIFIKNNNTIKEALKKLNITAVRVLLVVDDDMHLLGTLTDGDIRRYILKGKSIDSSIKGAFNENPIYLYEEDLINTEQIKEIFYEKRIELIPVIDKSYKVVNHLLWEDVFKEEKLAVIGSISLPLVIMAGGKGTRMAPFTNILPKPLIPIGTKTILECIIDEFRIYGVKNIYLTINYRGEMIKAYFEGIEKDYELQYFKENEFNGTASSLKLLENIIEDTFIVSNCDIIVKANYINVVKFHRENNAVLTIISSIQQHKVPYGVIQFNQGGVVTGIIEKPEYTFPINSGVYILDKKCLSYIPDNKFYNMTDLIEDLIKNHEIVLTYPVNQNDYIDIGQWEEYHKALDILKIKF